jgi:hypothetical protein
MVVWGDGKRLLVQVHGMEMVGGLHVCEREASGRALGRKPETESLWLSFGHVA